MLYLFATSSSTNRVAFDIEAETARMFELHKPQRAYHFSKDSISFANQLSESFNSVNRGVISQPSRAAATSRYHGYFSTVEFEAWDDISDPVIRFSDDGSLAYTIVEKMVRITYPDDNDRIFRDETHYAWTTIYRKYGDEWKIDGVTSTERPKLRR